MLWLHGLTKPHDCSIIDIQPLIQIFAFSILRTVAANIVDRRLHACWLSIIIIINHPLSIWCPWRQGRHCGMVNVRGGVVRATRCWSRTTWTGLFWNLDVIHANLSKFLGYFLHFLQKRVNIIFGSLWILNQGLNIYHLSLSKEFFLEKLPCFVPAFMSFWHFLR